MKSKTRTRSTSSTHGRRRRRTSRHRSGKGKQAPGGKRGSYDIREGNSVMFMGSNTSVVRTPNRIVRRRGGNRGMSDDPALRRKTGRGVRRMVHKGRERAGDYSLIWGHYTSSKTTLSE